MASAGVLLLLLMSSNLLICSGTEPSKKKTMNEKTEKFFKSNIDKIRLTVTPFLSLIPIAGQILSPIVNAILVGISKLINRNSDLNAITDMFHSLDLKLNEFHVEQKWDTWASGAYHKPEMHISTAWKDYLILTETLKTATDDATVKRQTDNFLESYAKYEPATKALDDLLTSKGTTFITKIGDVMAPQVHCHEREIRAYTLFIHSLIFKGNVLNQFYYRLKNINSEARVNAAAQTAYDAGKAMFDVQKKCISDSMTYVKQDVEKLMDEKKDHGQLAKEIRKFLDENYNTFDWMVVAYTTKNSGHERFKTMNQHVFSGFTKLTKGAVSVAVARQVKGAHNKAGAVGAVINKCIDRKTLCVDVPNKLSECKLLAIGNMKVTQAYTAVHAYKKDGHESRTGGPNEFDSFRKPESSPYYHTGKCKRLSLKSGSYTVMIKSDREMINDLCREMNCGPHGKCELIPETSVAVCECHDQYYGEKCEQSLDDYKQELRSIDENLKTLRGNDG
ncbi:uncharacterized protein [Leuresthes tenuis]|uniref:uncharacterized protein n=1 Tax=Leuresthes tenuis TaxID=355514 RepID=UPI003B50A7CC